MVGAAVQDLKGQGGCKAPLGPLVLIDAIGVVVNWHWEVSSCVLAMKWTMTVPCHTSFAHQGHDQCYPPWPPLWYDPSLLVPSVVPSVV